MIKLVIFDLWRTLIPATIDFPKLVSVIQKLDLNLSGFIEQYEHACETKKYNSFEELRKDFFTAFEGKDEQLLEEALSEIYVNRFDKIRYFPEVEATLQKLKQQKYSIALLSNTENLRQLVIEEKLKLKNYFDFLGYSFEFGMVKPKKEIFQKIMNNFSLQSQECVMVGDSLRSDISGAQSVDMHNCLIERDEFDKKFHPTIKPEFKITKLDEIFKVLGVLNG